MRKVARFSIGAVIISFATLLAGCGSIPAAEVLEPYNDTAKVYFIMPTGETFAGRGLSPDNQFQLWNEGTFLSNIGRKEILTLNLIEGTYLIMAEGGVYYIVQATLTAGETYYFKVVALPGFNRPFVKLELMDANDPELEKYMRDFKKIVPKGKVSASLVRNACKKVADALNDPNEIDLIVN